MADPMKGPNAIPTTLVNPNRDIGKLRAFSPYQTSLILPPTMLIETDEAPPPKKRVTTNVAKFFANADGNSEMIRMIYATKYPGIRPDDSVRGTKIKGQNAAPIFHDVVAQYKLGNGLFWTLNSFSIQSFPEPYVPAGRPVKIELVGNRQHSYRSSRIIATGVYLT